MLTQSSGKKQQSLSRFVDQSLLQAIQARQLELDALLAVPPFRQDFQKIWIVRDEIATLKRTVREQARQYAEEQTEKRLAAEAERAREEAEREVVQERQRLASERERVAKEEHDTARALIDANSLVLCGACLDGEVEIECPDCAGTGQGAPRLVDSSVPAVCSDWRATCSFCGGTGVVMARTRKLVNTCAKCEGRGEVTVPCDKCQGDVIISGNGQPFRVPDDNMTLVLSILRQRR